MNEALLIIDLQNDFLENGSLPVKNSNKIIPKINNLIDKFYSENMLILASKDFHPINHYSFASKYKKPPFSVIENKVKWPNHCVQNTKGSDFPNELHSKKITKVFLKGTDPNIESFSIFKDENNNILEINNYLKKHKIKKLHVVGLALDYCVKHTIIDALKFNYSVILDLNCTESINHIDGKKFLKSIENKIQIIN